MKKARTKKIFTLDTETAGIFGDLKLGALYDGEKVKYFTSFQDVDFYLRFLNTKCYIEPHVYIHFLDFDARKLDGLFNKIWVDWEKTRVINNRFVLIKTKYYYLHDSFSILPISLDNLSKSFDIKHAKIDLMERVNAAYPNKYKNKEDFFINIDIDDPIYREYLKYDVLSLYEIIFKLLDVSGLSTDELLSCLTTASISKYIFKNGYKGHVFKFDNTIIFYHDTELPKQKKSDYEYLTSCKLWASNRYPECCSHEITYMEIEDRLRYSYIGGRTEVFIPELTKSLKIVGFHYDVNSLYPSVMIDNFYPIGDPVYSSDPDECKHYFDSFLPDHNNLDFLHGFYSNLGFLHAIVYVPEQDIPPLPVNVGKITFPCGYIEGFWTYPELYYAIKECGVKIIEYKEVINFSRMHPVFHDFISTFSKMKEDAKKENNPALTFFCKLIMNTAYGWTALNRYDKTEYHNYSKINLAKYKDRIIEENEESAYISCYSNIKNSSIQVQVAAYVSSYARIVLHKQMKKQLDHGAKVYYCDTDSIVTDKEFNPEVVDKYTLGKWDLEHKLYGGIFIRPKMYVEILENMAENKKFKGITGKTIADMSYDNYKKILEHLKNKDKGKIMIEKEKEVMRSFRYLKKAHLDNNYKQISDKYFNLDTSEKRVFDYENNSSKPYFFKSIDDFHNFSLETPFLDYDTYGSVMDRVESLKK